ncbi:MAG: aldose 1-epimerase family protein [Bacteroidetes bacterium]|nr:aldose 1-epimerase family protein [Bacteroidota bacterium]
MHTIENEFIKVSARNFGAELTSLYCKETKTEHLWQADEKFWGWHAPVLFPVIGRCLNDKIQIDDKEYNVEKHGFARKSEFILKHKSDSSLVFSLSSNEHTLAIYPFAFEFFIGYTIVGQQLVVSYEVFNNSDRSIYFQIGGHPAFAVPFGANEQYEDYYLEFEHTEHIQRHLINAEGYFTGETEDVLSNQTVLGLRKDLFNRDALIFKNHQSRKVSIRSHRHQHFLSMMFNDFPYLGFWAKENAPYVCIEPWIGCADTVGQKIEFSKREKVISLNAGQDFSTGYSIVIG